MEMTSTPPVGDSSGEKDQSDYIAFPDTKSGQVSLQSDATSRNTQATDTRINDIVLGCTISIFAIIGTLLRIAIAQLFGEACANPGTIGWISSASPLCVTKDGDAYLEGGIIFADLPSNLLGSFIMGLFQGSTTLGLAVPMAIAWLSPNSPFQAMTAIHKGITTGFCGSLTTYSSWNSEMIVMIFGTGNGKATAVWRALFGYIVGMETAIGSFVAGKSLARRLHRKVNPILAEEQAAQKERQLEGVHINHNLPELERRFLPQLRMDSANVDNTVGLNHLKKWRVTTQEARRVGHYQLSVLIEIENVVLVNNSTTIPKEMESIARSEGWDVDALLNWAQQRDQSLGSLTTPFGSTTPLRSADLFPWVAMLISCLMVALAVLVVVLRDGQATMVTYRTMAYACLFAPSGALLRWKLSEWNGKLKFRNWEWLPLGTWSANVIGSCVSIAAVAWEYRMERNLHDFSFAHSGTLRAVKVGFAGCLTTVSTFVSEISSFMHTRGNDNAYPYILCTLGTTCALGSIIYACIIYI